MCDEWKNAFKEFPNIIIKHKCITKVKCDAVVSPANSFGYMDGSLDLKLSEHFGWHIQENLVKQIKELPLKELLVGQALTVNTNHPKTPYLISVPTMRVPTSYLIPESLNAYLAMKATLIEAKRTEQIKSIAIPAFCSGIGEMPYDIVARQMLFAYLEIELARFLDHTSFEELRDLHYLLNEPKSIIRYDI